METGGDQRIRFLNVDEKNGRTFQNVVERHARPTANEKKKALPHRSECDLRVTRLRNVAGSFCCCCMGALQHGAVDLSQHGADAASARTHSSQYLKKKKRGRE